MESLGQMGGGLRSSLGGGPPSEVASHCGPEEGPWGFAGRCDSGVPRSCCQCPWSRGHCWWGTDLFQKAGSSLAGGCSSFPAHRSCWHLAQVRAMGYMLLITGTISEVGSRWCLDQGGAGFGEIADGVIDGLVHHSGLDHLALLLVHVARIIADIKAVALLTYNKGKKR